MKGVSVTDILRVANWTSRSTFERFYHCSNDRPVTIGHWIKDTLKMVGMDIERFTAHSTRSASTSQAQMKGVPVMDILRVANWISRSTFERFTIIQVTPQHSHELCCNQVEISGTLHALNVPLVNTVPCIQNLQNTINRFPEDKVCTGRMHCMRRWRIQGTYSGLPTFVLLHTSTLPLVFTKKRRERRTRMLVHPLLIDVWSRA